MKTKTSREQRAFSKIYRTLKALKRRNRLPVLNAAATALKVTSLA